MRIRNWKQQRHGLSYHRLYSNWKHMVGRCINPRDPKFHLYGAIGAKVCDRWLRVENFIADMDEDYRNGHELHRIDNAIDYCKENCRWLSKKIHASIGHLTREEIPRGVDGKFV